MQITSSIKNSSQRIRTAWCTISPGRQEWRGAAWGLWMVLLLSTLVGAYGVFAGLDAVRYFTGTLALFLALALVGLLLSFLVRLVSSLPGFYRWGLFAVLVLFIFFVLSVLPAALGVFTALAVLVLSSSALGAGIAALVAHRRQPASPPRLFLASFSVVAGLVLLVGILVYLSLPGGSPTLPINALTYNRHSPAAIDMPDPSQMGPHSVSSLCYGNPTGGWFERCSSELKIHTDSIDGSAFVDGWNRLRTAYLGFGPEEMPLNGRAWIPSGDGPFPLVLIVHGNAKIQIPSDEGYAYLGEVLASRGFLVASLDQNYLNLAPYSDLLFLAGLKEENDARAWLVLEHARLWLSWTQDLGSPLYQKVDPANLALAGHSRGGEAAVIAAAFNRLPYYPDNANITFDYNFNIRSVVAISPSEGQYKPAQVDPSLHDINYLVLHGSHDMDIISFMGARQYARTGFSGEEFRFKASVYTYGANHGQFNTAWGRRDMPIPVIQVYNLGRIMPPQDQRQVATVYISAFLEATLHGELGYLPIFRDPRSAAGWLPNTVYLTRFADSQTLIVSHFEEDIDLSTASLPGGIQSGENLAVWREQVIPARWGNMGSRAVYLGWDNSSAGTPAYRIRLPSEDLLLSPESELVLSLADTDEEPLADRRPKPQEKGPIDLTIQLTDRNGISVSLPLSHFAYLQPILKPQLTKANFMFVLPQSEVILQTFEFRLQDFQAANPAFNPSQLAEIAFIFDRTEAGLLVLDDIGLRINQENMR